MESTNKKVQLLLVIKAIQKNKKLSIRKVIKVYNILYTTIQYRINKSTLYTEYRYISYNLSELEENIIIQYIIDLDSKDFVSKYKAIEDIANYILDSKRGKRIRK